MTAQPSQALPGPQVGARRMLLRDEIAAAVGLGKWHGALTRCRGVIVPLLDRGDVAKREVDIYAAYKSLRCSKGIFLDSTCRGP